MKTLHLVSILDRSGSMYGTEADVIGAYNSLMAEQTKMAKKGGYKAKSTLILFDDQYQEVYSKVPLNKVPTLTSEVYSVRGGTALNDAIGKAIAAFKGKDKVQFFIETDGYENSSREYSGADIKRLISENDQWDFNFVGADLSRAQTADMAKGLGIAMSKSMAFAKTTEGYATRNITLNSATTAYVNND